MTEIELINSKINERGLKKSFVAEKIGITSIYLSYLLNGKKPMTKKTRRKLYEYLNIEWI